MARILELPLDSLILRSQHGLLLNDVPGKCGAGIGQLQVAQLYRDKHLSDYPMLSRGNELPFQVLLMSEVSLC
jgi:hypothetical protein